MRCYHRVFRNALGIRRGKEKTAKNFSARNPVGSWARKISRPYSFLHAIEQLRPSEFFCLTFQIEVCQLGLHPQKCDLSSLSSQKCLVFFSGVHLPGFFLFPTFQMPPFDKSAISRVAQLGFPVYRAPMSCSGDRFPVCKTLLDLVESRASRRITVRGAPIKKGPAPSGKPRGVRNYYSGIRRQSSCLRSAITTP